MSYLAPNIFGGTAVTGWNTTSTTLPFPEELAVGDLLFIRSGTIDVPSGWSQIGSLTSVFYKYATSADVSAGGVAITRGATTLSSALTFAIRNTTGVGVLSYTAEASGTAKTATTATLSVTSNNCLLLGFLTQTSMTSDPSTGMVATNSSVSFSTIIDVSSSSGTSTGHAIASAILPTAQTLPATTFTVDTDYGSIYCFVVAIPMLREAENTLFFGVPI